MKYYVSVGRGGLLFRIVLTITRLIGSLFYWKASRRRAAESVRGRGPAALDLAQLATRNVAMASVSR